MKILYIITKSELGGAQMHVSQLMHAMTAKGHTVGIASRPGGWLEIEAKKVGVLFFPITTFSNSYNPLKLFSSVRKLQTIARQFSPDIVSCHSSGAGFFWRIGSRGKLPTIYTAHSWAFTEGAPFLRKIIAIIAEKMVSSYTNKIICVSEYDRGLALKYHIAPVEKLMTIHNGVTPMDIVRTEHERVEILSIGRLAYPKEYGLLIRSFEALPEKIRAKTNLRIIGEGPLYNSLSSEIKKYGLEKSVFLVGKKEPNEIKNFFSQADIFILLSKHEGFPMTILEAMAADLPVIASEVGGIPEAIDPSCGILVQNSEKQIVQTLTDLITDTKKQQLLGSMGKDKITRSFAINYFLEKTEKIYTEISLHP